MYDQQSCRVIFSRDVIFDESQLGIEENEEKSSENSGVKIQFDSNDQDIPVDNNEEIMEEADEKEVPQLRRSERTRQQPDYYGV